MALISANILATALFRIRNARMESDPREALRKIEDIIDIYTQIAHNNDGVVYLLSGHVQVTGKYLELSFSSKDEALKRIKEAEINGIHYDKLEKISAYGDIEHIKEW